MGLPVTVALLLIMTSWLRGRILDLLTLLHRPRVAAKSGLVFKHFQYPAGYRNYPLLSGPLRCTSINIGASLLRLLRVACVFVRHFCYIKSGAEVNWRMGVDAPSYHEIYLRSPALLFVPQAPAIRTSVLMWSQRRHLTRPQYDPS